MKKQRILLPITSQGTPDYAYMIQTIQRIEYQQLQRWLSLKQPAAPMNALGKQSQ